MEAQIEDLSTKGLRFARDNNFDEAGLAALRLAIDEARRAISDQRNELEAKACSSPMPRSRDHQRPNLTTEGLVLILIDVAHENEKIAPAVMK